MKWSKRLFYGEKASKQKFKLIKSINKKSFTPFLYIVLFIDEELCILSQIIFNSLYYKKKSFFKDFFKKNEEDKVIILGIAISKYEAQEVLRKIVSEVYENTGSFDYKKYFMERGELY